MTTTIDQLHKVLADYEETADAAALELGLSFAQVVLRELWLKQWSQKDLATRSGLKESFLSRVLHSDQNWTRDTAGRILHALGVRARIEADVRVETDVRPRVLNRPLGTTQGPFTIKRTDAAQAGNVQLASVVHFSGTTHGQETKNESTIA